MFNFLRPAAAGERLSTTDAVAMAAKGELTVIDCRDMAEARSSGKAKGALVIPLSLIGVKCDPKAPDCPKGLSLDKPIGVYCASGARSGMAAGMLRRLGYEKVYNLGGLYDWKAAGGVIERM